MRNGIDGEKQMILDGRFQYIASFGKYQAGLFLEIYNLLNTANFGNPTGRAELGELHEDDRRRQRPDRHSSASASRSRNKEYETRKKGSL